MARKSRKKRRRRKVFVNKVHDQCTLALLNIQGGNGAHKWVQLEKEVRELNVDMMCITETHFSGTDAPPNIEGYNWLGCNYEQVKQAGVGILFKNSFQI